MIISLLGFTFLAAIILTSTTLYDSKKNSLITEYVREYDLENNNLITGIADIYLNHYDILPSTVFNENFTEIIADEIFSFIKTYSSDISSIVNNLDMSFSMEILSTFLVNLEYYYSSFQYFGYNDSYSVVLESLLESGSLPNKPGEVLVPLSFLTQYGLTVGDYIFLNATNSIDLGVDSERVQITGVYLVPSSSVLESLCKENNLSYDTIYSGFISGRSILAPHSIYMRNFENITTFNLAIYSTFQLDYDFSGFEFEQLEGMLEDFDSLVYEGPYNLLYYNFATWEMYDEFYNVFDNLTTILSATQFLIIFLSIPILYLGWFLVYEINELFSSSFEQEIRILRSKGVSTGNITFIYLSMKLVESLAASFLGFGLTMLLLPPLLRIDSFISFNSQVAIISLKNLPIAISLSFVLLVVISIPRIIKLTKKKKEVIKPPSNFRKMLREWIFFFIAPIIIIFGAGIIYLSLYLFQIFFYEVFYAGEMGLLLVFVYLAGIGVMIILLGLGLLLKGFHKILMIFLSKISWNSGKNIVSFSLVEVRSDINLFNTTFLTYVILIGIVMPFIVSPISIQNSVETEAFFYGGSDLYIDNWRNLDSSLRNNLSNYDEIESIANISVIHFQYGTNVFNVFVIDDPQEFLESAYQPPDHLIPNWEQLILGLETDDTMIVSKAFHIYMAGESDSFTFYYQIGPLINEYTYNISGVFSYFPIFYDVGDTQYVREYSLVTTLDDFLLINSTLFNVGIGIDRMLVKLKPLVNPSKFADKLERDLNININVSQEKAEEILFNLFPFYPLIVAEFVFGILICLSFTIFTSMSNPLKILQSRSTKHDVLKKIGIPTRAIIFTSALEFLIASIGPGLLIGGIAGFGLVRLFDYLLLTMTSSNLPNVLYLPTIAFLLIFLGIPTLFYAVFYSSMKYNFAKYRPQNLE